MFAVATDADVLVNEGIALRRAGRNADALEKFEQAHAIVPSPRTTAQMGLAEHAIGRWGAADRHLHAALTATDDVWIVKNRGLIERDLKVVAQHCGHVEIGGNPTGAEVLVDGELIGQLPLPGPIAVTAGGIAVEVRAPGYVSVVRPSFVAIGGLTRESFNLQSVTPEPIVGGPGRSSDRRAPVVERVSPNEERLARDQGTERTVPITSEGESNLAVAPGSSGGMAPGRVAALVAAGLAVGALATGIYEHVQWQDQVSKFAADPTCDLGAPSRGSAACQSLYDRGQSAKTIAFVGYGVAGAFAATAVVLYLVSPPSPSPASPVAFELMPGHVGLTYTGRF